MKKLVEKFNKTCAAVAARAQSVMNSNKGDVATSTIGGIVVGVIIVAALVALFKSATFQKVLTDALNAMGSKFTTTINNA